MLRITWPSLTALPLMFLAQVCKNCLRDALGRISQPCKYMSIEKHRTGLITSPSYNERQGIDSRILPRFLL